MDRPARGETSETGRPILTRHADPTPQPGDHTVCQECAAILVLKSGTEWQEISDQQWLDLPLKDRGILRELQAIISRKRGPLKQDQEASESTQHRAATAVIAARMLHRSFADTKVFDETDPLKHITLAALSMLIDKGKFKDDDAPYVLGASYALTCVAFSEQTVAGFKEHWERCCQDLEKELAAMGARVEEDERSYHIKYRGE